MKLLKKIDRLAQRKIPFTKGKIQVWMLIAILVTVIFAQNQMYSITGNSFEGPQQEFVAVGFDNQPAIYQGQVKRIDGKFYEDSASIYASKWDWENPSSVHLDPDSGIAGIPDMYFTDAGYGSCDENFANSGEPIDKTEYTVRHDGKDWKVVAYLYYFKTHVRLSSIAGENLNLPGASEVAYNVKADVYCKIGINRWSVEEYNNELWSGILKVSVVEVVDDGDTESRTYYSPSGNTQLALADNVGGRTLGQYDFDDLDEGWQNPDAIPSKGYYKMSLDFKSGRTLSNKIKHPWVRFTVVAKVLVTHRWILTDEHLESPIDPIINDDQYEIEQNIWIIIDEIIAGVDVLTNLLKLLFLIVIGFFAIVFIMMILAGVLKLKRGSKR